MMVCFTSTGTPKLLYCGKWSCSICRKHNADEWAHITRYHLRHAPATLGKPRFWTFTLPSGVKTAAQGYSLLKTLWDNLRKELQRDQGKICYLAFVEGQGKRGGMPHFHVIIYAHVPKRYNKRKDKDKNIKDFAVHVGFGHQAKDEPITSGKAAAYVSKYVSKGTPDIPKYFRRVRPSQDWIRPPRAKKGSYIVRGIGENVTDYLLRVEQACELPMEDLLTRYRQANLQLEIERLSAS